MIVSTCNEIGIFIYFYFLPSCNRQMCDTCVSCLEDFFLLCCFCCCRYCCCCCCCCGVGGDKDLCKDLRKDVRVINSSDKIFTSHMCGLNDVLSFFHTLEDDRNRKRNNYFISSSKILGNVRWRKLIIEMAICKKNIIT